MQHFIAIGEFKLVKQSGNTQSGSNSMIFRAVRPWNLMDDLEKKNRTPLLSNIKLCASFHHHMLIQTGVTVRKRLSWGLTSVTLTFDLRPWPFAWTSLQSLVITPENFMMIHDENIVKKVWQTEGWTAGLNHSYSCLVAAKDIWCPEELRSKCFWFNSQYSTCRCSSTVRC